MFNFGKKNKKPENLKEVLAYIKGLEKKVGELSETVKKLEKDNKFCFQKIGIVRYNPFSEIGGNQSFTIAMLDNQNNGFVISSLFIKEGNRVYAKAIKNGDSEHALSIEEKKAIEEALKEK